jgi:hypothetical protein
MSVPDFWTILTAVWTMLVGVVLGASVAALLVARLARRVLDDHTRMMAIQSKVDMERMAEDLRAKLRAQWLETPAVDRGTFSVPKEAVTQPSAPVEQAAPVEPEEFTVVPIRASKVERVATGTFTGWEPADDEEDADAGPEEDREPGPKAAP